MPDVTSAADAKRKERIVIDREGFLARGVYFDVLALAVFLISAGGLAVDAYVAGQGTLEPVEISVQVRIAIEAIALVASFTWIATRLVLAGFRDRRALERGRA